MGYFKYLVHILEHTTENLFATPPTWVLIMLAWLLALAGAVLLARKAAMLLLLVLYGGAHFAAYLYLRPFTEHIWHLYPGLLIFSVCAVAALLSLLEHANRTLRWGAIIVLFSLATLQASRTVGAAGSYRTNYWNGARNQAYYDLSTFLRRSVPPEDVVATVEVGTIAYYSGLKMYDLGGLITLAPVSPQARAGLYRWLAVDGKYLHLVPGGARPVAAFRRTQFHVFLFDLAPAGPRR